MAMFIRRFVRYGFVFLNLSSQTIGLALIGGLFLYGFRLKTYFLFLHGILERFLVLGNIAQNSVIIFFAVVFIIFLPLALWFRLGEKPIFIEAKQ